MRSSRRPPAARSGSLASLGAAERSVSAHMISPNSVVMKTGQAWKLRLFIVLMLCGGSAMFGAQFKLGGDYSTEFLGVGTLVALLSFVFASLAIRCPSCGARWFWLAISRLDQHQWFNAVINVPACPQCNFTGEQGAR